jgi:anaerobic magnesium-protoporphyrin IX monomethyl ester cyclase
MADTLKTVLVNPAWHCLQNHHVSYIPLGLAYIAGALTSVGHAVQILDGERILSRHTIDPSIPDCGILVNSLERYLAYHNPEDPIWTILAKEILSLDPAIVGFSMWTASFQSVINTASALKQIRPDLIIIAGGIHPTIDPLSVIKQSSIDYVVSGEGDTTSIRLWDLLRNGQNVRNKAIEIPGVWTNIDGQIRNGGKSALAETIDDFPFPNYETVINFSSNNIAGIITSRGCPYGCSFCASESIWTRKVRYRGIDHCLDELAHYRKQFDLRTFRINDDTFCIKKERLEEFCSKLAARFGNTWDFTVDANVDSLDSEKISLLKNAGCRQINFGIESVAPRIQNLFINKTINQRHAIGMVEAMYAAGIESGAYFMTGFPGETEQELEESIAFMEELTATHNIWSIVSPYPGTQLHAYSIANGYLKDISELHLMHHSLSSSMADIKISRYKKLLETLELRVEALTNRSRIKMKLVDIMDQEDSAGENWPALTDASIQTQKHCGYVDELNSTVDELSASGWAYNPSTMAPVEKVVIFHKGKPLGSVHVHFQRFDVAKALKSDHFETSGWRAIIPSLSNDVKREELDFIAASDRQLIGYLNNPFRM